MLKQVGSVVVAGLVGAMSYSAQGETPNPLIPIVFAGGAFLGATVLFNKLEPDLSVPVVAAAPVSSSSSNTYESGKKKGKKATKQVVVKKEEPKVVASLLSSDDEVDGDEEEVAPVVKKVDKKKKKSGGAKKEEKKAAPTPAPVAAEKKATKDAPKKAAKKEEKKAAPAPAVVKKDEKKDAKKDGKKAAPAAAAATAAVGVAKKDEKKDGKKKKSGAKKEEKKAAPAAPVVASATSDDDEDGGWEVVRKQRPVKEKDTSAKGDGEVKEEVKEKKFDSTIRIPSEKYGAIIGTKGETLQQLEKKTGAKITIPKEGEIVNVWGTVEQVKNAKLALQEFAEKGWSRATHQGWEDSDFKYANEKDIAKILGVGGVNIKKFQSEFKVIINTPKEGSLERVITINGERDNVRQCKAAIKDLLQLGYSPLVYPDFITRTIPVTKKELLAVMGKGGCNVKHIQKTTGIYAINTPKKEEQAAEIAVTLIGYPAQVDKADSMVRTYLAPEEPAAPSSEWEEGAGGFNEETAWD